MDLHVYLKKQQQLTDDYLLRSFANDAMPARLREAMSYSLKAGGKRIRPILAFATAEALGHDARKVMPLAIALEMIHTFSLIHDDLPAMDDDDLRRGQPTNHKVFGEATAILAGDALLAEAFFVLTHLEGVDAKLQVEVLRDVAVATGARGMTGGQQFDIDATGETDLRVNDLEQIHRFKTGALLQVPVTAAAKLCGASSEELAKLSRYGAAVGLAFQIADDILDITGTVEEIGKDVGSDRDNHKTTYVNLLGIDGAQKKAASLVQEALLALQGFDAKADALRAIAKYIIDRKG